MVGGQYLYGGCSEWQSFVGGVLLADPGRVVTSVLLMSLSNYTGEPEVETFAECSGDNSTDLVSVLAGTVSADASPLMCSDAAGAPHGWSVLVPADSCTSETRGLCVDCDSADMSDCSNQCRPTLAVSPCQSACAPDNHVRVLAVSFRPLDPAPNVTLLGNLTQAERSAVTVSMALSGPGIAYCMAGVDGAPVTVEGIVQGGQWALAVATGQQLVSVRIIGLTPVTNYTVFCAAVSRDGAVSTLEQVLAAPVAVTTSCCRIVTLQLRTKSLATGASRDRALTLSLDPVPTAPTTLTLTIQDSLGAQLSEATAAAMFYPWIFHLGGDTTESELEAAWTGVIPTDVDAALQSPFNISVSVAMTGTDTAGTGSDHVYSVVLEGGGFVFSDPTTEPSAPLLVRADFSDDGSWVQASFDSPTDRGGGVAGMASQFICGEVLSFANQSLGTCAWVDSGTVRIFPGAGSQLGVGSSLAVRAGVLRAECTALADPTSCTAWSTTPTSSVNVSAPSSPTVPRPALTLPSSLGACDALVVEIGSSEGAGGRPWASVVFEVVSDGSNSNASEIQTFLNSQYELTPPTPVPRTLFVDGSKYYLSVTLCNFLGACATSTQSAVSAVNAQLPSVAVLGAATRSVERGAALVVNSDAFMSPCGVGARSYAGLVYSWRLLQDGSLQFDLTSTSKDPAKLTLPAYSLGAGVTYTVELSVLSTASQRAVSAAVQVSVTVGRVVATIAGGSVRSLRMGSTLVLDAGDSYDEDQDPSQTLSLLFQWQCHQTAPVLGAACALIIRGQTEATMTISAATELSGGNSTSSQLTVTVSDESVGGSGVRKAQASVTVVTVLAASPEVAVKLSSSQRSAAKLNVGTVLNVFGSVVAFEGGWTRWSVDDGSVSLAAVATTPLNNSFSSNISTAVYLSLPPLSLPPRASLVFTLTCVLASGATATSSVRVTTNGAPLAGLFSVSPTTGSALNTSFLFAASAWDDEDVPLSYSFGFTDAASGDRLTLQARSEVAHGSSQLSAGLETEDRLLTCRVIVYDFLGAASEATARVRVDPPIMTTPELAALITQAISASSGRVDATRQALGAGSGLLNQNGVSCTSAPNCTQLHRTLCSTIAHTCGPCLAGHGGDAGAANTRCVAEGTRLIGAAGGPCASSADCDVWSLCNATAGVCVRQPKMCAEPTCSGHGSCFFELARTHVPISNCLMGDVECTAVCQCDSGFGGSYCGSANEDMMARREARDVMVSSLFDLTETENPTSEAIASWSAGLSAVAQQADEMSSASVALVGSIAGTVLTSAVASDNVPAADLSGLVGALDNMAGALIGNSSQWRQPTGGAGAGADASADANNDADALVGGLVQLLKAYAGLVAAELAPGQPPVANIKNTFRLSTVALGGSGGVTLAPQSVAEELALVVRPQVDIGSFTNDAVGSGEVLLAVSLVMGAAMYNNSGLHSDPLFFSTNMIPCSDTDADISDGPQQPCRLRITLANNKPVPVDRTDYSSPFQEFVTTCLPALASNHSYLCADGTTLETHCDGIMDGNITSFCPNAYISSVCNSLQPDSSSELRNDCTVESVNETYLTCSCPPQLTLTPVSSPGRRRLADGKTLTELSNSTIDVNMVSMFATVTNKFATTFVATDRISGKNVARSMQVVVVLGLLLVFSVVGVVAGYRGDAAVRANLHRSRKSREDPKLRAEWHEQHKRRMVSDQLLRMRRGLSMEEQFIEESLPNSMKSRYYTEKFLAEVRSAHKFIGVFFHHSAHFPRPLRVLMLVTGMLTMLFMQAFLYPLAHPDDGSCAQYVGSVECLADVSSFGGGTKCRFIVDEDGTGQCSFNPPGDSAQTVIFMTVMATIMAIPLDVLADWLILNVLVSPIASSKVEVGQDTGVTGTGTGTGKVNGDRRASLRRQGSIANTAKHLNIGIFVDHAQVLGTSLGDDITSLSRELKSHREMKSDQERREFDRTWGLRSRTGEFRSGRHVSHFSLAALCGKHREGDVHDEVMAELKRVRAAAAKEITYLEDATISKKDRGRRLIRILQQDLLPSISGRIVESTAAQERSQLPVARPLWQHRLAWATLVVVDLSMLYYIFTFSIEQSNDQQDAWTKSFLV